MKSATLLLISAAVAQASSGDRNPSFQRCLSKKIEEQCHPDHTLSLPLRLTGWTCEDDCKYQCTHLLTDEAIWDGRPIEQFYGKWAFWRFLGIQEPASMVFSLFNLWAHIRGGRMLRRRLSEDHPMRPYYLGFTVVNLNVWVWSTIFHTRDKPFTERMDYFSAGLGIMYGLYYGIIRLYHLYVKPTPFNHDNAGRHRLLMPWTIFCALLYFAHVTYLILLPTFDYGWNMKVNVIIGMTYNLLWISYSLPNPPFRRFLGNSNDYRPSYVFQPAIVGVSMMGAVCLEIFDFPPWWRIIDAHSLWHLATAPIIVLWYRFLVNDSADLSWKERIAS